MFVRMCEEGRGRKDDRRCQIERRCAAALNFFLVQSMMAASDAKSAAPPNRCTQVLFPRGDPIETRTPQLHLVGAFYHLFNHSLFLPMFLPRDISC